MTFEVIRTFQRESARAKNLLGDADAVFRGEKRLSETEKVREELELLKSQEGIP